MKNQELGMGYNAFINHISVPKNEKGNFMPKLENVPNVQIEDLDYKSLEEIQYLFEQSYRKQIKFTNKGEVYLLNEVIALIQLIALNIDSSKENKSDSPFALPDKTYNIKDKVILSDKLVFNWIRVWSQVGNKFNWNMLGSYLWKYMLTPEEMKSYQEVCDLEFPESKRQAILDFKLGIVNIALERVVLLTLLLHKNGVFTSEKITDIEGNTQIYFSFIFKMKNAQINLLSDEHVPLPMVVPPKPVDIHSSGFLMEDLGFDSIILNGDPHSKKDYYLEYIDYVNSIPCKVNKDILDTNTNYWDGIYNLKADETEIDIELKKESKAQYDAEVKSLEGLYNLNLFSEIYFPHKYDTRGRVYSIGYHFNPEGTAYNKACILLANAELLDPNEILL